jgi:Fic family protein
MNKPLLYLSKFFERHKGTYYDNLMRVREQNDMIHWLRHFLVGVRDTAIESADTLSAMLQLKNDLDAQIGEQWGRRTRSALNLLQHLFTNPVVKIKDVQKVCNLSPRAAGNLVHSFDDAGILKEITGQSRNMRYVFKSYLDKFKE